MNLEMPPGELVKKRYLFNFEALKFQFKFMIPMIT